MDTKFFEGVPEGDLKPSADSAHTFDFDTLIETRWEKFQTRFARALFPYIIRWIHWRRKPVAFVGMTYVAHASDVEEILGDRTRFTVPFGPEMGAMAPPVTFGLGRDDVQHDFQREVMEEVMRPGDLAEVGRVADQVAAALIADAGGRIEAMSDYVQRILTEVCFDYFGLRHGDPDAFAKWNHSVSAVLFGKPYGSNRALLDSTFEGARRLSRCIDHAVAEREAAGGDDDTLIGRMVRLRQEDRVLGSSGISTGALNGDVMRAILFGMSSGMIPTTQIACGHIFEVLRNNRDAWQRLARAARADKRDEVREVVMELARLRPTGFPGHMRFAEEACALKNREGSRARFKARTTIMVCTAGALRDPKNRRNPHAFRPGERPEVNHMFGAEATPPNPPIASHSCVGRHVAEVVMTSAFLHLFALPGLKPERRRQTVGFTSIIPVSYPLTFDGAATGQGQTMLTIAVPVPEDRAGAVTERLARDFGNPASPAARRAFAATGCIHTASMTVAALTEKGAPRPTLLIEFNGDGAREDILRAVGSGELAELIKPVLELAGATGGVTRVLDAHVVALNARPSRSMGLTFNGVPNFSVPQIAAERTLARYCEARLAEVRPGTTSALELLQEMREEVRRGDPPSSAMPDEAPHPEALRPMLYRAASHRVPLSAHREKSFYAAVADWSAEVLWPWGLASLLVLTVTLGLVA
ncbi:MAG: hypothetical protein AAFQ51_16650, partial [Pseudomonadota bacterium]